MATSAHLQLSFIDSLFTTSTPHPLHLHSSSTTNYPHPPLHSQNHLLLMAAADNCVMAAMDALWFHQIILSPEPNLFHFSQKPPDYSSENIAPVAFHCAQDDDTSSHESDHDKDTTSHSSSSPLSPQKRTPRLQKTMSCKTLQDLELEELKGFMDLGFSFRKENLSKRIVDLIPGLQRISDYCNDEDEDEDEDEEKGVMRPYLSEAWIIKRPDSPLLNWRMPRVSTAADMKKHLKHWAQTVASAIQQEEGIPHFLSGE